MITAVDLMEMELTARLQIEEVARKFMDRHMAPLLQAQAVRDALMQGPGRVQDESAARLARRVSQIYHGGSDVRVR